MEKKRKLKKFASQADYDAQKDSVMGIPHVVLLNDTRGLVYKPKNGIDYSKEYFTIESLEDSLTVSFSKSGLEYSINNGAWNSLSSGVNTSAVNTGDKISFRGSNLTPSSSSGIGTFTISKKCSVQGNIMSLLFGDGFKGKTDLTGYDFAFYGLFNGCKTLINASNLILPATTLAYGCYSNMFNACASLTEAPALPATTLTDYCYSNMFRLCFSLATAPELPATTLALNCYYNTFSYCTNLTEAPELPAITLADSCYYAMFYGCTGLTEAPELPATTLVSSCYYGMFYGCGSLNHITMLATDISAWNCLYSWVYGVPSSGVFVKSPSMTSLPSGEHGIPAGWEVNNMSPCIINTTSTSITFNYTNGMFTPNKESIDLSEYLSKEELLSVQPSCDIVISLYDKTDNLLTSDYVWEYSKTLGDVLSELSITTDIYDISVVITEVYEPEDNGEYYYLMEETEPFVEKDYMRIVSLEDDNTITFSQATQYSINGSEWKKIYGGGVTVNNGDKVYLKNSSNNQRINSTKLISVEGNIMSLLFGVDFEDKTDLTGYDAAFVALFNGCTTLTDASNLILPAATLATNCYYYMFYGCNSLTSAPELPAITLATNCYSSMFSNCTSLTEAPALPATTLADYCYAHMFYGCTSLTVAPALPATTLASYCYYSMFYGCTSLTTAPELPATTLASYCYYYMFYGCNSLTEAPELPATTLASYCYNNMFYGCTSLTSAPELPATTLATNCYSNMFNGCTGLTEAPELPATTLAISCYYNMFNGCSSLTTSPELPATTLKDYCYSRMFNGCTSLNHITMLATDISASYCLNNWVNGVSSSGTFVKNPSMTSLSRGSGGIPDGWTVEDYVE